jgi:hypothetical protein
MVLDLHPYARLESGQRREKMVQHLLGGCSELVPARADLDPTSLVTGMTAVLVIALCRPVLVDVKHDGIALVGQVHIPTSLTLGPFTILRLYDRH